MENVWEGLIKAKGLLLTVAAVFHTINISARGLFSKIIVISVADQFENGWADYIFAFIAFFILILFYLLNRPKTVNDLSTTTTYGSKRQPKKKPNPHNKQS